MGIHCALYARSATDAQTGNSVGYQIANLRAHARGFGWEVVSEYYDRAASGNSPNRDGMRRVIDDAKSGAFEVLLVASLDRISRDEIMAEIFLQQMKLLSVKVYSLQEGAFLHCRLKSPLQHLMSAP